MYKFLLINIIAATLCGLVFFHFSNMILAARFPDSLIIYLVNSFYEGNTLLYCILLCLFITTITTLINKVIK